MMCHCGQPAERLMPLYGWVCEGCFYEETIHASIRLRHNIRVQNAYDREFLTIPRLTELVIKQQVDTGFAIRAVFHFTHKGTRIKIADL